MTLVKHVYHGKLVGGQQVLDRVNSFFLSLSALKKEREFLFHRPKMFSPQASPPSTPEDTKLILCLVFT